MLGGRGWLKCCPGETPASCTNKPRPGNLMCACQLLCWTKERTGRAWLSSSCLQVASNTACNTSSAGCRPEEATQLRVCPGIWNTSTPSLSAFPLLACQRGLFAQGRQTLPPASRKVPTSVRPSLFLNVTRRSDSLCTSGAAAMAGPGRRGDVKPRSAPRLAPAEGHYLTRCSSPRSAACLQASKLDSCASVGQETEMKCGAHLWTAPERGSGFCSGSRVHQSSKAASRCAE